MLDLARARLAGRIRAADNSDLVERVEGARRQFEREVLAALAENNLRERRAHQAGVPFDGVSYEIGQVVEQIDRYGGVLNRATAQSSGWRHGHRDTTPAISRDVGTVERHLAGAGRHALRVAEQELRLKAAEDAIAAHRPGHPERKAGFIEARRARKELAELAEWGESYYAPIRLAGDTGVSQ